MDCKILQAIKEAFPEAICDKEKEINGTCELCIKPQSLYSVCEFMHSQGLADYLEDITAIDFCEKIDVVYRLRSFEANEKIALRVSLDGTKPEIESLTPLWRGADFQEREIYDLMGVVFLNHPNLVRILLDENWEGHPLRKNYVINKK